MSLKLSLFHRPGSVLFLDDDADYLEMLGMVVPDHWQVELFSRPAVFSERMRLEPSRWEADASLQLQMIDRKRNGHPLIPQILRYWANYPSRYQLAQTCVVDYAMPGTNGLSVLNTLLDWPGARVLLTGQADEQIAIQAFNNGLIDQFIPKQTSDITDRLLSVLNKLAYAAHPRLNTMWRSALRPLQQSLLQIPSVARSLLSHATRHWVEYVVLDEPFGVLALDADGQCHWMQLEATSNLKELADLASSAGMGFDQVRAVQSGGVLPAVELHQQLGLPGAIRTAPTFPVGDDGLVIGAVFSLDPDDLPAPIYGYRHALEARDTRIIQDG